MKRLLVGLAVVAALGSAAPAEASTPMPWCGIGSSDVDRLPDATPGFAVHVAYVRPPGAPDRLAEWAPRIVGDVAAIDAWWRSQDPTRAPRFDLFPFACASPFGQLDISNVTLPQPAGEINTAFTTLRFLLAEHGFIQPEKAYLVYYDGPVEQAELEFEVCGVGDTRPAGSPASRSSSSSPARRRRARSARSSPCTSSCTPSTPSPAPPRTTAAAGTSATSPTTC